ncbi:ketoacyl-ACP synthase III [Solihabitans fulvus]|uniref:Ketoacyl-ACP synthase III n=1 Tax=Solihabitans fulvus TaxID=1892852 RepID=A0A5B2XIQ9_9PSEU|nr:3-oxoacyl-[acyl-carrier-protein] synthase III C-terminal domain-containing protein [Solihabitans fulvus]KAA2262690.1 ketoacyl-ACP synthase III [Solihabitans fulvus]
MSVRILSTGAHLPGDPIDNDVLAGYVGPLPQDVLAGIQVQRRHWIADPETGEHSESNADLAHRACASALAAGGVPTDEVDLLVLCTASPDYLLPPMVTLLQDRLGLARCATVEIRSGCAGFVEGLEFARLLLESGAGRTALVVGSETISPLLVPVFRDRDPRLVRMRDRLGLYSFGDGAGAVLLRADGGPGGLRPAAFRCVGGGHAPGMQIVGGGTATPLHRQLAARRLIDLRVDVVQSAKRTPSVITEGLADVLGRAGLAAEAVDVCVLPEGNAEYLTEEMAASGLHTGDWLALQHKVFENLTTVGATGSAAVPIALDEAWRAGRLHAGDEVMLLAVETSKWKYAGTVLTWTAAEFAAPSAGRAAATPVGAR